MWLFRLAFLPESWFPVRCQCHAQLKTENEGTVGEGLGNALGGPFTECFAEVTTALFPDINLHPRLPRGHCTHEATHRWQDAP